ncbi:sugar phosphate isomerase/epimerase family protein [Paenibacillus thailandensis]|uniref:Sugar phosphate isomerase/epimerase family protein n=1 Tax=Paenibacillus thailandensis TaxID=393250 RepID=A0ABW5R3X0_9BACL
MKLCYNSNGLRNVGVLDAVKQIKAYGYDGVELSFHDNHVHPLKTSLDEFRSVKECCGEIGLEIACLATGAEGLLGGEPYEPSLIHPDAKERQRRIDVLKRSVEIANLLDIPVMNLASGKLKPEVERERAYEYLLTGIGELTKETGDAVLAVEPEPDFFIGTSREAVRLIRDIDHPRFMLNLDIGHVYCCEDDFIEAIQDAVPYTRHIHIEDIKNRIHYHEIPGQGDIDFEQVFSAIGDYKHYISIELYHHADVSDRALEESRSYLLRFLSGQAVRQ